MNKAAAVVHLHMKFRIEIGEELGDEETY